MPRNRSNRDVLAAHFERIFGAGSKPSHKSKKPVPIPLAFTRVPPLSNELFKAIFVHNLPVFLDAESYRVRQSTLRSLCLVSKRFNKIFKPLLFAVAKLSYYSQSGLQRISFGGESWKLCRKLVIEWHDMDETIDTSIIDYIVDRCPNVTELVIDCTDMNFKLDLSQLEGLQHLKTLRLAGIRIDSSSSTVRESLEHLELVDTRSWTPLFEMFNTTTLPSLRFYSFRDVEHSQDQIERTLELLEPRLEAISTTVDTVRRFSHELLSKLDKKTLFDKDFEMTEKQTRFSHIRATGKMSIYDQDLESITNQIHSSPSDALPSLLFLDASCESEYLKNRIGRGWYPCKGVCEERGVEVVFEEQVDGPMYVQEPSRMGHPSYDTQMGHSMLEPRLSDEFRKRIKLGKTERATRIVPADQKWVIDGEDEATEEEPSEEEPSEEEPSEEEPSEAEESEEEESEEEEMEEGESGEEVDVEETNKMLVREEGSRPKANFVWPFVASPKRRAS